MSRHYVKKKGFHMEYICKENAGVKWNGSIKLIQNFGAYYEATINGRGSHFHIVTGEHRYGYFICIPNHDVGCELATYDDLFWNYEQLSRHLSDVDALTVATGISHLRNL